MSSAEILIAIAIVVAAIVGAYVYMRSEKSSSTPRPKLEEGETATTSTGSIVTRETVAREHVQCDPFRTRIRELEAELAMTPDFDPLRRSNISGALSIERVRLDECERQALRSDLQG